MSFMQNARSALKARGDKSPMEIRRAAQKLWEASSIKAPGPQLSRVRVLSAKCDLQHAHAMDRTIEGLRSKEKQQRRKAIVTQAQNRLIDRCLID